MSHGASQARHREVCELRSVPIATQRPVSRTGGGGREVPRRGLLGMTTGELRCCALRAGRSERPRSCRYHKHYRRWYWSRTTPHTLTCTSSSNSEELRVEPSNRNRLRHSCSSYVSISPERRTSLASSAARGASTYS